MTAFIIPMDLPGIEIRPIQQMSGGASFNEVFFTDVRVPDSMRLGGVGDGWRVALTTLGFERDRSGEHGPDGSAAAGSSCSPPRRAMGVTADPVIRQRLADAYIHERIESVRQPARRRPGVRRRHARAGGLARQAAVDRTG